MAGLLAWAADVVGGGVSGRSDEDNGPYSVPLIFTPEQQSYVNELDSKAAYLNRAIQDLRSRLPPPDISQRLPHLHAHSLASNAALALQLNAHSATKQQVQLREVRLLEENKEYENAISNCEIKIQEKLQESDALQSKLKEMELFEENLKVELQKAQTSVGASHSEKSEETHDESKSKVEAQEDIETRKTALIEKLEDKRKELSSLEDTVQVLEKKWQQLQDNALKQPTPGQREKALDKQLHSLIEQLAVKQAQAEGLAHEVHLKKMELEKLTGLLSQKESSSTDVNLGRNRFGRSGSGKGPISDYDMDTYHRLPVHTAGRSQRVQRLMLLRSAFVLYILVLHVLVFIKISF